MRPLHTLEHDKSVLGVALSEDGSLALTASLSRLTLWELSEGGVLGSRALGSLELDARPHQLAASGDGRQIVLGDDRGRVLFIEATGLGEEA